MQQSTITLVVAVVGITGTLGGVVLGQWMSRSWQREQWLLDNRKQEFHELVSALTSTVVDVIVYKEARDAKSERAPEFLNKIIDTHHQVYNVIADRIYIAKDVKALNIIDRYIEILRELRESTDDSGPADRMSELIIEIVAVARLG
jgi:hypothetical protein